MSDNNNELGHLWRKLDDLEKSHKESMKNVSDSLNGVSGTISELSTKVTQITAHSHDPMSCLAMARHEKDHEKSGSLLRNISIAIGIVAIIGGLVAGVVQVMGGP